MKGRNPVILRRFQRGVASIAFLVIGFWVIGFGLPAWADNVSVDCSLKISWNNTNAVVSWRFPPESGTNLYLQAASNISGPWSKLTNPAQPLIFPTSQGGGTFVRAIWDLPEAAPNASDICQLIRNFAFSTRPGLNPAVVFNIQVEPIQGLWETMQIEVVTVVETSFDGQFVNAYACLIHKGNVQYLGIPMGGLMSGLMQGTNFYYTYSFGSGIRRSEVGMLRLVNDEVNFWGTQGLVFQDMDLYLSRRTDGKIAVESGGFGGFNLCLHPQDYGLIDETDPSATKIIDLNSNVLATLVPTTQ
jgi:hypothetical protein